MAKQANGFPGSTDFFQRQVEIHANSDVMGIKPLVAKMTPEEVSNLAQVIEGRTHDVDAHGMYIHDPGTMIIRPMNQRVAQVAPLMKEYFDARRELAEKIDIEGFKGRKAYFPEFYKTDTVSTDKYRLQAIEGLAAKQARAAGRSSPLAEDYSAAQSTFELYVGPQYAKVAANLQKQRFLDMGEGRILDPMEVISRYSHQFWHAYYKKAIFGATKDGHPEGFPLSIAQALGQLQKDAVDGKLPKGVFAPNSQAIMHQAEALVRDTLGIHPHDPVMNSAIVRTLGNLQTLKLSLSVFKNATQTMNTWYATSLPSVFKAVKALLTNSEVTMGLSAREYAGMMASVFDNALYEATLYQGSGVLGKMGETLLKYTGFTTMEKVNRAVAGLAGSFYADRQAKMLVQTGKKRYATALREMGINPEQAVAQGGALSAEQMLLAGQRTINSTQFRSRLSDLPYFATQNPGLWRMLLQFRTFSFNHARLVSDGVKRHPARLALFGTTLMPLAGMGVNFMNEQFKEQVFGITPDEAPSGVARYLDGASTAGSFGIFSDMLKTTAMGHDFKGYLTPPVLSSVEDYLNIAAALGTGETDVAARYIGKQFGGLGSAFVKAQWGEQ